MQATKRTATRALVATLALGFGLAAMLMAEVYNPPIAGMGGGIGAETDPIAAPALPGISNLIARERTTNLAQQAQINGLFTSNSAQQGQINGLFTSNNNQQANLSALNGFTNAAGGTYVRLNNGAGTNTSLYRPRLTGYMNGNKQSITNLDYITATGRVSVGVGLNITNIAATSDGARQYGFHEGGTGGMWIGPNSDGAWQSGNNGIDNRMTIGSGSSGANQNGENDGTMFIGDFCYGCSQEGNVAALASLRIGNSAYGAHQYGYLDTTAAATNDGVGALQLLALTAGQRAHTTSGGKSSLLLGAGTSSNKNAIVAGDGSVSHGDGTITASGGFWGPLLQAIAHSSLSGITGAGSLHVSASETNKIATALQPAATNGANILADLGGGSGTTFYRKDGTWQTPAGGSGGTTTNSVENIGTNYTVTLSTECGYTLISTNAAASYVRLPSVGAANVGWRITVVKLAAGNVTVDAADSDTIADSGAGDGIRNTTAAETWATLTLQLVSATKWVMTGGHGTWTTFD